MHPTEALPLSNILNNAERELSAFLLAAADLVDLDSIPQAGDLWISAMEDAGCPGANLEKFFRTITIRAVAQLTKNHNSSPQLRIQNTDPTVNVYA